MKGLPSWFMALWCVLMPLTSFLLIPSAQGTIPAYMLAFVSACFVIVGRDSGQANIQRRLYFTVALLVAGILLLLLLGGQPGKFLSNRREFCANLLEKSNHKRVVLCSVLFFPTLFVTAS